MNYSIYKRAIRKSLLMNFSDGGFVQGWCMTACGTCEGERGNSVGLLGRVVHIDVFGPT